MTEPHQTRAVNEWLSAKAPKAEVLALMCECGATSCRTILQLSVRDYRDARSHGEGFLVVEEHWDDSQFEAVRRRPDVALVRPRV